MFRGSFTALVTPFKNGGLDEQAFRDLVEWQISEGTDGLVPVGTTGESPTLSHDEHHQVVEWCVDQAKGRVPVVAGAGSGNTPSNSTQSGCLIATAAFGSELAPQVQDLRNFRDGIALNTLAGSNFMTVFNGWYYSFSPHVADFQRDQPWLNDAVRLSIYPLIGILDLSTGVYDILSFNGEAAIVGAGLVASALIGLLYFAPISAVLALQSRRRRWNMSIAKYALASAWVAGLAMIAAGQFSTSALLMAGTALLVLSMISTVILAVIRAARL